MADTPTPVVVAESLTKTYHRGHEAVHALDHVSFTIESGEFVAVVGPSGAGKTTFLNFMGCLDVPTSGSLHLAGQVVAGLSDRARTRLRREHIAFVFQHFGLLPTLTVAENIALPALFAHHRGGSSAQELLTKVRVRPRRAHCPHQLFGGEMQRVAIARALINLPRMLLADEPTGNLDSATIIELFQHLRAEGLTIIVVTHNDTLAAAAQRQLRLRDGRIEE